MRKIFLALCWVASLSALPATRSPAAADPVATPSPTPADAETQAARAFADELVAAPDDATRRRLLAAAPPALARGEKLRRAFNHKAGLVIYSGDYARAGRLMDFLEAWSHEHNDKLGLVQAQWGRANIAGSQGNNQAALAGFEACQRFFTELGDKERIAAATVGASIVHLQLGNYRRAMEGFRRAHAMFELLHDKEGITNTLNSIGSTFNDQGMRDNALEYWQRALASAGDDASWQTILFNNLATVYHARDDDVRAIDYVRRALALAEKTGEKGRIAVSHDALGDLLCKANKLDEAQAEYEAAYKLGEEIGDLRRQFSACSSLAAVAWKRGQENALATLVIAARAEGFARQTSEPAHLWEILTFTGRVKRVLGYPAEARAALEEAVAIIEESRGRLSLGDEGAVVFLEDKVEPFQELVALLVDEKKPGDALRMAERAKARVLIEVLRSARIDPQRYLTEPERARLKRAGDEVTTLNKQLAQTAGAAPAFSPADRAALEERLRRARLERTTAEGEIVAGHPELRNRLTAGSGTLEAGDLAALADGGKTALLEYVVTEKECLAFVSRGGETQVFRLPLAREALAARTRAFRQTLAGRDPDWRTAARALGNDLLAATRPAWDDARQLVIVPDGVLWELPFQTLIVPAAASADAKSKEATLVEKLPVSLAPSLAFLAQSNAGRPVPTPGSAGGRGARLLALGAPTRGTQPAAGSALMTEGENAPLPDAGRQLRELGKLYGDGSRVLIGNDAREETFKQLAGDFDILHFATHGLFNDGAPLYSRLLLSQDQPDDGEDGFLEAWELLGLKLRARLAVLSACETGRGRIGEGEGLFGLSWALLTSGCPEVIVSQWKVDSASTTDLMLGLHRRLREGREPVQALREASLELMRRPGFNHPFYWAPFVSVGAERGG